MKEFENCLLQYNKFHYRLKKFRFVFCLQNYGHIDRWARLNFVKFCFCTFCKHGMFCQKLLAYNAWMILCGIWLMITYCGVDSYSGSKISNGTFYLLFHWHARHDSAQFRWMNRRIFFNTNSFCLMQLTFSCLCFMLQNKSKFWFML